ncbi:MAG: hypothetical protein L6R41_007995, partial [Letrouitia leprolyta]
NNNTSHKIMFASPALLATLLLCLQTTHSTPTTQPLTLQSSNPNFLGINCYHLSREERVNLHSCQALFAHLAHVRDVYQKTEYWNGWVLRAPPSGRHEDQECIIQILSGEKRDHSVFLSRAEIITLASEVLQECETGGANGFKGRWSVVVTKEYIREGERVEGGISPYMKQHHISGATQQRPARSYVMITLVEITVSLHGALKNLQRPEPRSLWADAICIDQSNIAERSSQVTMMGAIYERALSVQIWLGEDVDGDAQPAFESL